MAGPRMAGSSHNIPSVPRIALPNPHVRKPSLSKSLLSAQSDADGRGSMDLSSIPVPSIPAEYQRDRSLPPPAETIGRAVSTSSPIDGHTPIMSATAQRYTPVEHQVKHISISPDPASNDSGYDSGSSNQKSPVVPMRSMFPTYNPNVPLSQQSYHPQRPPQIRTSSLHLITRSTPEYKDNGVSVERLSRYPSAPPSVVGISETPVQHISSQRELCHLWEASHGMEPNALTNSFDLELARPEEATFTLSSDPLHPFYTMTTYDTNELAISKTHPKKQKVSVEVSLNTIEPAGRRKPPQDGLVTFIFPKMAAMLAINQSTALAKDHGLAPTHRDEVQAAAVRRAAEQEACKLRWNAYSQVYELEHPAIGRRQQGPSFAMSPDPGRSPLNTRQALEIRIHANGNAMPVITVACPQQSDLASEPSPSIPGIRMSTMRNRDSDNALAVLDLNTRILHIEANRILEQLPSLFAIDSIVSALFTVLVADEHVNPVMAEMELWTPKPRRPQSQWGGSISGISGVSHAGSGFYTTFAEREEAEAEAKELAEIHEKDVRQSARKPKNTHKSWFSGKEKAPKQKKKKQIVIADFDMEKLGHYQAGERKGQELPAVTRATLSVLVGGLKAIVWLLTSIVQFITWLLVNLTRCFTSEKF